MSLSLLIYGYLGKTKLLRYTNENIFKTSFTITSIDNCDNNANFLQKLNFHILQYPQMQFYRLHLIILVASLR